MKQFLGIILNYFQKQNFVWKFKCKKIALLLVFMQLCSMQKFSKHFSSFQLVFITFYKKQFKTPKTCSKKQLIFRTNSEKKIIYVKNLSYVLCNLEIFLYFQEQLSNRLLISDGFNYIG